MAPSSSPTRPTPSTSLSSIHRIRSARRRRCSSAPFYENCRRALAESGLIAAQTGVPFFQPEEVVGCHRLFAELFAHSGFFLAPVPAYYGGAMAFGWASDALELAKPERKTIAARCAAAELATGYYNPEVHCAAFALPNYIRELASLSPER